MTDLLSSIENLNHLSQLILDNIVFVPVVFIAVYTAIVQVVARI